MKSFAHIETSRDSDEKGEEPPYMEMSHDNGPKNCVFK